jgi:hypothetical protein
MVDHGVIAASEPTGELPVVRSIGPADLKDALAEGLADLWAMPRHVVFISLIYPIFRRCAWVCDLGKQLRCRSLSICCGLSTHRPFRCNRSLRAEPAARNWVWTHPGSTPSMLSTRSPQVRS